MAGMETPSQVVMTAMTPMLLKIQVSSGIRMLMPMDMVMPMTITAVKETALLMYSMILIVMTQTTQSIQLPMSSAMD